MTSLVIANISAGYGRHEVLRAVSLSVASGKVVAVVGPNGAGKSTLIKVLSGIVSARAGEARVDGVNLLRLAPAERARRLAVVPQMIHLPDAFTVGEIVLMGRTPHLHLWAGESRGDCEIAWGAMRRTQVEGLADRRADELSGGELQRVVIARALAQQPRILLLDEPTAHLDLKHQLTVLELVRSLARAEELAVLMTLHDLNQAALYADHVALMQQGAVVAQGPPWEVLTAERLTDVYGVTVTVAKHPTRDAPVVVGVEPAQAGRSNGRH